MSTGPKPPHPDSDSELPNNRDPVDWPAPTDLGIDLDAQPVSLQRRYAGAIGFMGFMASIPGWFLVDNFAQLAAVAAGPLVVIGLSKSAAAYMMAPVELLRQRLLERRHGKGYRERKKDPDTKIKLDDGLLAFFEKSTRLEKDRYRALFQVRELPVELQEIENLGTLAAVPDVALSSLKKDSFRHLSHQMKTPLGLIIAKAKMTSEVLLDVASSNQTNDNLRRLGSCLSHLEMVDRTATDLGRLAEQMLSMAFLDTLSRDQIQRQTADITNEILEVVSSRLVSAKEAGDITLNFKTGPDLNAKGNAALLREMISAIVDNSIKYSPAGSVIMIWAARSKQEPTITIWIGDAGPGIPESEMEKVFEPFYGVIGLDDNRRHVYGNRQNLAVSEKDVEATASKRTKGGAKTSHGLGLALVKAIVDVHGGTIALKNIESGGVIAGLKTVITLPAAPPDPDAVADI
ncbi:MAG: HAMP domain-containing sensor histidine kinase [Polaromonas sp.]|nr:HAMP domain-containing sensor histidine kinase [Polaromonas sp.]